MSKQQVAFIGLGVMGYPMAGHLAKAGYQTRVYNRTAAKAEQWCQQNEGSFALTPREAAEGADFVFMCVGNDDDLRSVVYGDDGVLAGCKPGSRSWSIIPPHLLMSRAKLPPSRMSLFSMRRCQVVRRGPKTVCSPL